MNITGNVNTEVITAMVEVLKNTSTLVTSSPPGIVYRNANVWIGLKGFATPRNIKEGIVRFRVETSWMTDRDIAAFDIKLLRWDAGKWVTLETAQKDKDSYYTYFESRTDEFSPLAIVGITEVTATSASAIPVVSVAAPTPTITAGMPLETKPSGNDIMILVLLMIGTVLGRYLHRKGKSR